LRRVEFAIAASADAGIQQPARQAAKQQRPQRAISTAFKWKVQQIVDWRYALISRQIGRHAWFTSPAGF